MTHEQTSFFKFILDRHHLDGHTEFYLYSLVIADNAEIIAWPQDVYWLEGKKYLSASGYARACGAGVLEAVEKLALMPSLDIRENIPPLSDEDLAAVGLMSQWLMTSELEPDVTGKSVRFMELGNDEPGYTWIFEFGFGGSTVSVTVDNKDFVSGCRMGYCLACGAIDRLGMAS